MQAWTAQGYWYADWFSINTISPAYPQLSQQPQIQLTAGWEQYFRIPNCGFPTADSQPRIPKRRFPTKDSQAQIPNLGFSSTTGAFDLQLADSVDAKKVRL